jgi:hypothetical protein
MKVRLRRGWVFTLRLVPVFQPSLWFHWFLLTSNCTLISVLVRGTRHGQLLLASWGSTRLAGAQLAKQCHPDSHVCKYWSQILSYLPYILFRQYFRIGSRKALTVSICHIFSIWLVQPMVHDRCVANLQFFGVDRPQLTVIFFLTSYCTFCCLIYPLV